MVSLSLPTLAETTRQPREPATHTPLVIASVGNRAAADIARLAGPEARYLVPFADDNLRERRPPSPSDYRRRGETRSAMPEPAANSDWILFVNPHWSERDQRALSTLVPQLEQARFIAVVGSFRTHLGDAAASAAETRVLKQIQGTSGRVVLFRAGNILGTNAGAWLHRIGWVYPLVPGHLRSCFVDAAELHGALERVRHEPRSRRPVTLLGPNQRWRDVLRAHRPGGILPLLLSGICFVLALTLVGHLAARVLAIASRWRPALRRWNFDTLRPQSFAELLALCGPDNIRHVKVVGYNNGVNHFGHHYSGKTVVSTIHCRRMVRTTADTIKADCGVTIHQASAFLAPADQELFVLPNYSYVCLGTAFFVPIHGSAVDVTTVAETFIKALLYDPESDRFLLAGSDEPAFREYVYNFRSRALVLRVWMRVKHRTRYFVHRQDLDNPGSDVLLAALRDDTAANVEIRQAKADAASVRLSKYYQSARDGEALEIPRDALGRLWDKLEENVVTSFLLHAATRWFAWHVELFFSAEEFAIFWKTHRDLPLRKLQLRYIRRDSLPHSPFCEHDCISVDMFMLRWHRTQFEAYLKETFGVVRSNPGKHSS